MNLSANIAIASLILGESRLPRRSFQWRQLFEQDEKSLRLGEEHAKVFFDREPSVLLRAESIPIGDGRLELLQFEVKAQDASKAAARSFGRLGAHNTGEVVWNLPLSCDPRLQLGDLRRSHVQRLRS